MRTAVVGSILVLHKPKIHYLQISHGQQQQLFSPPSLRKAEEEFLLHAEDQLNSKPKRQIVASQCKILTARV